MATKKQPAGGDGAPKRAVRPAAAKAGAAAKGGDANAAARAQPTRLTAPLGQGELLALLLRSARALRLHHGLVITGAQGSGKSTVARWLAAALLCPSDLDDSAPCGVCRTCRRVASGQHPDLHVLRPQEDKTELRVEQVRELQDTLTLRAVEGRARVVLIDPADTLNEESQNALLKTLEEPGPSTFLVLVTSRPDQLLPTVRSRCERLIVRGLAPQRLAEELSRREEVAPERRERALKLARGSLGRALTAATERTVQIHDLVLELLSTAKPLRPVATARAVLEGSEGRAEAIARARSFLQLLAIEAAAAAERGLADGSGGSYVASVTEPWVSVLELALAGQQDLELQIPPDQVVTGAMLAIARLLRAARGAR